MLRPRPAAAHEITALPRCRDTFGGFTGRSVGCRTVRWHRHEERCAAMRAWARRCCADPRAGKCHRPPTERCSRGEARVAPVPSFVPRLLAWRRRAAITGGKRREPARAAPGSALIFQRHSARVIWRHIYRFVYSPLAVRHCACKGKPTRHGRKCTPSLSPGYFHSPSKLARSTLVGSVILIALPEP